MKVGLIIIVVIMGLLGLRSVVRPMIETIRYRKQYIDKGKYLEALIAQILVICAIIIITIVIIIQISQQPWD